MIHSYLQLFEIDFDLTFAVVLKPMAFRVLFVIEAYYNLDINQRNIKIAFLYRIIDQLVYVQIGKG